MGNELSKKEKDLVSLVQGNELGDLIKPMIREIHLFDSFVAGTTHLEDKSVLENVNVGDMLSMQREDGCFRKGCPRLVFPFSVHEYTSCHNQGFGFFP